MVLLKLECLELRIQRAIFKVTVKVILSDLLKEVHVQFTTVPS